MKIYLIFIIATLFPVCIYAQSINAADSLKIFEEIADWNTAWKTRDYKLAAKWYTDKAAFTNAFGDKRTGRQEIESLLKEVFSLSFVMSGSSETTNHSYQYIAAHSIIVHTTVIRKGQQLPDGSPLAERRTTHLRVFIKEEGNWQIGAHLISDARDKQGPKH